MTDARVVYIMLSLLQATNRIMETIIYETHIYRAKSAENEVL